MNNEDFLEDEAQEGVSYVKPNLEMKLTPQKKQECREVVAAIKQFGVNQRQLLFVLELLALELENMEHVKKIKEAIQGCRESVQDSAIIISRE
jgi:hypothetical protein